jgi:peptidylprolyl isomerase
MLVVPAALLILAACGGDDDEDTSGEAFATTTPAATDGAATTPEATQNTTNCPAPTGTAPEVQMKSYSARPEMTLDPSKTYTATVKTVRGDFVITLRPDLAPEHVNSFVFLAREGYYNGVTFHRVIPGFVAQGGDPTGTGTGGPGYNLPAEFTTAEKFERGTVGMARSSDPNSAGSQFFINYAATPNLDGQYTIFGEVTSGMDVVDCITPRDPSSATAPGDAIISIDIAES